MIHELLVRVRNSVRNGFPKNSGFISKNGSPTKRILLGVTIDDSLQFIDGFPTKLVRDGWEVHVTSSPGPRLKKLALLDGVHARPIDIRRAPSMGRDILSLISLGRMLAAVRPVTVIFGTPKMSLLGIAAAFLSRVPRRIYLMHGLRLEGSHGTGRKVLRLIEYLICAMSTEVIAVSPSLREVALTTKVCDESRIRVLGDGSANGVDVEYYHPPTAGLRDAARTKLGISNPRCQIVLVVGRLTGDKGLQELPEIIRTVSVDVPEVLFMLVGHNEALTEEDAAAHDALAGMANVRLHEHSNDILGFYYAADVLLLPTHREGLPTVILEAAACELPAVTTTATGAMDAVVDSETGYLSSIGDVVGMGTSIIRVLQDEELRLRIGAEARKRTLRKYSQEVVWERWIDHLK